MFPVDRDSPHGLKCAQRRKAGVPVASGDELGRLEEVAMVLDVASEVIAILCFEVEGGPEGWFSAVVLCEKRPVLIW